MLNGIDPIIIFHFSKNVTSPTISGGKTSIPVASSILSKIPLPAIPIYLSERLSGLYIDTEEKNVDIDTTIDTLAVNDNPQYNQRGINNNVKVSMVASRSSVGLSLFSALTDLLFPLVTSKEYEISYLHGAVVVFGGLLKSFSITQDPGTDKYNISFDIIKPALPSKIATVNVAANGGVQLTDGAAVR